MSHLVENMAYVGAAPWHQLGNELPPKQSLEVWAERAGMNWRICETPVQFATDADGASVSTFEEQKVLFRSDTKRALSVVSGRYQVVQPLTVLEFYRDLTEVSGYELETAGVLKNGKKFWALARIGKEAALKGGDLVRGYLASIDAKAMVTSPAEFGALIRSEMQTYSKVVKDRRLDQQ